MTKRRRWRYGDQILVPWGRGEVPGMVIEVYGPQGHRSVLVRVPTRGPLGETLEEADLSFPVSIVRGPDGAAGR